LAVPLALWISPEFMLQVSYWVEELLTTGSVSIDSSMMIHELNTQMKIQEDRIREVENENTQYK
jgi:hypothetical protein